MGCFQSPGGGGPWLKDSWYTRVKPGDRLAADSLILTGILSGADALWGLMLAKSFLKPASLITISGHSGFLLEVAVYDAKIIS